jgi:hypothetical protein
VTTGGAERLGWIVRDDGPADADHAVLLLPGALATPAFYDDVLAEPTIGGASIRFVATTLPGFGGTPAPDRRHHGDLRQGRGDNRRRVRV